MELKIPEVEKTAYDGLFGNTNSTLTVRDGLLFQTFEDDIKRDPPLIIKYKWNGKEFAIVSIKKTGVFKTSYDCGKAESETEKAVCHVKQLADLDVQLGSAYKSVLANTPAGERFSLRAEQRNWMAERDKECVIYKGWVQCLSECYHKRIDELTKRRAHSLALFRTIDGVAGSKPLTLTAGDRLVRAHPVQYPVHGSPRFRLSSPT